MNEKINLIEYPIEEIPNEDLLYYRIHAVNIDNEEKDPTKKIKLVAFDPHPKGSTQMSTNWDKYSTALELQQLAKVPENNGVVSFVVNDIRKIPYPLEAIHDPVLTEHFRNQAHTVVVDIPQRKNDIGIRLKLRDICSWEILIKN
jgi:hypothetical protein